MWRMSQKDLPHFSRIFNANFRKQLGQLSIWIAIITFLAFLFSSSGALPYSKQLKWAALKDYQNPQNHLNLAKEYLGVNDLENAKRELLIGLNFAPENEELKKTLREVENLLGKPGQVEKEIKTWEKITQDFPGYRDAYLKLAQLYFTLYQNDKAQENLGKALELDPNSEPAREFEKVLGESQ